MTRWVPPVADVLAGRNLMVGKAKTALLDLQPGNAFEIKLGKTQIRLIPVGGADEDERSWHTRLKESQSAPLCPPFCAPPPQQETILMEVDRG